MKAVKNLLSAVLVFVLVFGLWGCEARHQDPPDTGENQSTAEERNIGGAVENIIYIKAGEKTLTADLEDNSSADALVELLKKGDITVDMSDYGGFEKVGNLPEALPQNNRQINTEAGDLILYQGNKFVIYYGENSWSLTKLGKIRNADGGELKSAIEAHPSIAISLSAV